MDNLSAIQLSLGEAARILGRQNPDTMSGAAQSKVLRRLAEAGLVELRYDEHDRPEYRLRKPAP